MFKKRPKVARAERTTCHVITSNSLDGVSRVIHVIAHTNTRPISHVSSIDVEVGERGVGASELSSCCHQYNTLDIEKLHVGDGWTLTGNVVERPGQRVRFFGGNLWKLDRGEWK